MSVFTTASKCDGCGRFYRWEEPGSSWVFVPDSYVTHEESLDYCAVCTAKHGAPTPRQNVNVDMYSGTFPATSHATKEES